MVVFTAAGLVLSLSLGATPTGYSERVAAVTAIPGCVAFWDFSARERGGEQRFVSHCGDGHGGYYPLDVNNYVLDYWGRGRQATYADFPLLGRGPFGQAVRIRAETDEDFRPLLSVPRARLHDTPLDIKGRGRGVSVVVWAIRESGNHALAGIWHEGTDLRQAETEGLTRVERGQRQYALFAGLEVPGAACGHVSENGAGSFLFRYAQHKAMSEPISPRLSADSPPEVLDSAWHCFAMTFDPQQQAITAWLDGTAGDRWLDNPRDDPGRSAAYRAWRQTYLHDLPGLQAGEDPSYPSDQYYRPPETEVVSVEVLVDQPDRRVELREYPYSRVQVVLKRDAEGGWTEEGRDLVAVRLNPWWYPHGIYEPANDGSGGPFTIGRVIHSARSVGFAGWLGGVVVYERALEAEELARLAAFNQPLSSP